MFYLESDLDAQAGPSSTDKSADNTVETQNGEHIKDGITVIIQSHIDK